MNYDFLIDDSKLEKFVTYYRQSQEANDDSRILYVFKSPDFRITIYNSKKVVFQGKNAYEEYAKWADVFGLDIEKPAEDIDYDNIYFNRTVIGSDEVGTGDFFGPVVVCSALVGPKDYEFLERLKIRDSKALSDTQIKEIAAELLNNLNFHVLVLNPEKYNQLIDSGYNMNKIKAYLHNHAIKRMVEKRIKFDYVIVDQFCSPENYFKYLEHEDAYHNIRFHTKGESIHKAVAVASIIARYKFLLEMDRLSTEVGVVLPKGAGAPADAIAKLLYLKEGKEIFRKIAKLNFKNTERIFKE